MEILKSSVAIFNRNTSNFKMVFIVKYSTVYQTKLILLSQVFEITLTNNWDIYIPFNSLFVQQLGPVHSRRKLFIFVQVVW
jgi:hypothetical protein